jgi:hypothetical protein
MLYRIDAPRVPDNWTWVEAMLAPAVRRDDRRDMGVVHGLLLDGRMQLWVVDNNEANGLLVTSIEQTEGVWRLWVNYVAGKVPGGLRAMRDIIAEIETMAGEWGCTEVWLQGRDWRRVLTDYEPTENVARNELRKVL